MFQLRAIINYLLNKFFGVEITLVRKKNIKKINEIFTKLSLIYDVDGFYKLEPMPDSVKVNEYYENIYWKGLRGGKSL